MKRVLICVAVCAAAASAAVIWVVAELVRFDAQLDLDRDAAYATFAEAEADGAVGRGWIRSFVPKSATDIRESHNIERSEIWLRFSAPAADIEALESALRPLPIGTFRFPGNGRHGCGRGGRWS